MAFSFIKINSTWKSTSNSEQKEQRNMLFSYNLNHQSQLIPVCVTTDQAWHHATVQWILYHHEQACLPLWWTPHLLSVSQSLVKDHWRTLSDSHFNQKGSNLEIFSCFTPGSLLLLSHSLLDQWGCLLEGDISWDPRGKVRREAGWNGPSGRSQSCR